MVICFCNGPFVIETELFTLRFAYNSYVWVCERWHYGMQSINFNSSENFMRIRTKFDIIQLVTDSHLRIYTCVHFFALVTNILIT